MTGHCTGGRAVGMELEGRWRGWDEANSDKGSAGAGGNDSGEVETRRRWQLGQ